MSTNGVSVLPIIGIRGGQDNFCLACPQRSQSEKSF